MGHMLRSYDTEEIVELDLQEDDVRSIINEFVKYRRNIKLGARFLRYFAYTRGVGPKEAYRYLFSEKLHPRMEPYL